MQNKQKVFAKMSGVNKHAEELNAFDNFDSNEKEGREKKKLKN